MRHTGDGVAKEARYRVNATVVLDEKHCLCCPLRKDDGSDECVLQDCYMFTTWEEQMAGCPLVGESEALGSAEITAEKLEKALDRAAKYVAEVVDVCPVALDFGYEICKVNDCYDGEAACWKKYFLGEDNDERD